MSYPRLSSKSNPYLADLDVCLMLEFQKGNRDAFETLMRKYYPPILNFIYRMLGDRNSAEDLTQEVFIRVYKSAARYSAKSAFKTWLYLIARNLTLNECRRRKRWLTQPLHSSEQEPPRQFEDKAYPRPDEELLNKEKSGLIQQAIDALPPKQRLAVILRAYDNFSYEEIARTLEVSAKAVKSLLNRARETLKERMPDLNE